MKVVVDGLMTEYEAEGRGKAVLFLHGWGSSKEVFKGLGEELKDKYRVVAVNLPGFGGTDEPKKPWEVDDYVEFVASFLKKAKVPRVYAIVGHSFGGRVMIKGCTNGKLNSEKLVFIDAAGVKSKRTARTRAFNAMAKVGNVMLSLPIINRFRKMMKIRLYRKAGVSDYLNASELMRETFKKTIDEDLSSLIKEIRQKCLIIWGEDDHDTPVSDVYIFKQIKHSRAHILSGAGHYAFLDKPEETARLVKDFLR